MTTPPQTTPAKPRGDFVRAAQEHRRDFTVDWVHLKLNDQAQRTVLCKNPFTAVDARVEHLIEVTQLKARRLQTPRQRGRLAAVRRTLRERGPSVVCLHKGAQHYSSRLEGNHMIGEGAERYGAVPVVDQLGDADPGVRLRAVLKVG